MLGGEPVLGIVLARGGSKRLPKKNILSFRGRPLIDWTVSAALESSIVDRLVLSSDDDEIINVAMDAGCEVPFRRPDYLASDSATSIDVILHVLDSLAVETGYFVLLQPTSPLRTTQDIDECLKKCYKKKSSLCASVSELEFPASWLVTTSNDEYIRCLHISDDISVYRPNGAVYVAKVNWFRKHKKLWVDGQTLIYKMPIERSVDIDTKFDFHLAELLLSSLK